MNTKQLTMESDVINLVGYETIMKFKVISEGIATYSNEKYSLDLFIKSDITTNDFLYEDSFSNCLSDYQIFELVDNKTKETLYRRTWIDDFDSNESKLGRFLNRCGAKGRFDRNVKEFSPFSLKDVYKMEDWVVALGNSFLFSLTGKEEVTWNEVLELAIEEQEKTK